MNDPTSTMTAPPDLRTERQRERVLDALTGLTVDGTREVSVHDVARAAGLSRTSVYHLFPSGLEDMAIGLVDTFYAIVEASARREIGSQQDPTPHDLVRAHLRALVHVVAWRRRLVRSYLDWKVPSQVREYDEQRLAEMLHSLLRELDDAVPVGVEQRQLARFLAGGMNTAAIDWVRSHDDGAARTPEQLQHELLVHLPRWFVGQVQE